MTYPRKSRVKIRFSVKLSTLSTKLFTLWRLVNIFLKSSFYAVFQGLHIYFEKITIFVDIHSPRGVKELKKCSFYGHISRKKSYSRLLISIWITGKIKKIMNKIEEQK